MTQESKYLSMPNSLRYPHENQEDKRRQIKDKIEGSDKSTKSLIHEHTREREAYTKRDSSTQDMGTSRRSLDGSLGRLL